MVTWLGQAHLGWSPFWLTQNQRIWDLNYICRIPPLRHTPHPIHRSHSHSRRGGDTGGAHQQESQPPTAMPWWNCHPNKEGEPGHMTGEVASGGQGAAGEPLEGRPGWVPCPPLPATQECSTTSLCSHTLLTHSVTTGSGLFIISDCNFLFSQTPTWIPWHFCRDVTFSQLFPSPSHTDHLFCSMLGPSQSWCATLTKRFRVTLHTTGFPIKCATSPRQSSPKTLTTSAPISG